VKSKIFIKGQSVGIFRLNKYEGCFISPLGHESKCWDVTCGCCDIDWWISEKELLRVKHFYTCDKVNLLDTLPGYFENNKYRTEEGYILLHKPGSLEVKNNGWGYEHRIVMAEHLGYAIGNKEVHHKNERRNDNRLENLQVLTKAKHAQIHEQIFQRA
jgi:hypothetical protein